MDRDRPFLETVCITFESDNSGTVNVFYRTGNPGRSVVLVDGLRLALEGYSNPPDLSINGNITMNGTDTFCGPFSVDLDSYVVSTGPGGSVLTWSTNPDPLVTADHLTNTMVNTPGVYYVFYYNPVDNCASPTAALTLVITDLQLSVDTLVNAECPEIQTVLSQ